MTDAEILRAIAKLLTPYWDDERKELRRIAARLEDLDAGEDPRDGILGPK